MTCPLPETATLALEPGPEGWLTVWLDDPARRNPLTAERVAELAKVVSAIAARSDLRGIVIRGRGGVFSAGGDLRMLRSAAEGHLSEEDLLAASRAMGALLDAVAALPQYTVMAVEGAAMAGGCGLAAAGDLVLAEEGATFAFSETRIGLVPAQIAPTVIARLGLREARRLLLLGARLTAREAATVGLVDRVVPNGDTLDAALDQIRMDVARAAPGAVAATKALLRTLPDLAPEARVEHAAGVFAACFASAEAAEGVASFFEKRVPLWAGTDTPQ